MVVKHVIDKSNENVIDRVKEREMIINKKVSYPNIHTAEGFQKFLKFPILKIQQIFGTNMAKAFILIWDAMWIWRVVHIRNNCSKKCPKGQMPSFTGGDNQWGDADVCSFSYVMANTLRTFIDGLMNEITQLDPPCVYPDLIIILRQFRERLWGFLKGIEPDEDLIK